MPSRKKQLVLCEKCQKEIDLNNQVGGVLVESRFSVPKLDRVTIVDILNKAKEEPAYWHVQCAPSPESRA